MSQNQSQLVQMDQHETVKINGHYVFRSESHWTVDGRHCGDLPTALRFVDRDLGDLRDRGVSVVD